MNRKQRRAADKKKRSQNNTKTVNTEKNTTASNVGVNTDQIKAIITQLNNLTEDTKKIYSYTKEMNLLTKFIHQKFLKLHACTWLELIQILQEKSNKQFITYLS